MRPDREPPLLRPIARHLSRRRRRRPYRGGLLSAPRPGRQGRGQHPVLRIAPPQVVEGHGSRRQGIDDVLEERGQLAEQVFFETVDLQRIQVSTRAAAIPRKRLSKLPLMAWRSPRRGSPGCGSGGEEENQPCCELHESSGLVIDRDRDPSSLQHRLRQLERRLGKGVDPIIGVIPSQCGVLGSSPLVKAQQRDLFRTRLP